MPHIRHFRNRQTLLEPCAAALAALARAIEAEIDAASTASRADARAPPSVAWAWVICALARQEPGLFRTAFAARPLT